MGIPLWKSVLFFALVFLACVQLFPSDRELGLYYATEGGELNSAQFFLSKQFYRDPGDSANTVRYLKSLDEASQTGAFESALAKLIKAGKTGLPVYQIAGDFYERREDLDRALPYWRMVLDMDPKLRDYRFKIISYYLLRKELNELASFYEGELRRGKAPIDTYYDLGRLYMRMRQADEAEALYLKLLALKPTDKTAKLRLIDIYDFRKEDEKLFALYRELVRDYPNDETLAFYFADALLKYKRFQEALLWIQDCAARFGGGQRWMDLLLDALLKTDNKAEAVELLEKLRRDNQLKPESLKTLAEIYFEMGAYRQAKEILQDYHEKTGGDYRSHHVLGDVLTKLGDAGGGKREYEEALRLIRS